MPELPLSVFLTKVSVCVCECQSFLFVPCIHFNFPCKLQLGLIIRSVTIGHAPPTNFLLVTMGSTAVLLIGWRALLFSIFPTDQGKKNDVYKRGSPFELFELLTSLVRRW